MKVVQPIRETRKIEAMKKILRAGGKRNEMLFVLGINSALRMSDLLSLTVSDILDENGKVREAVNLSEQKTGKNKLFPLNDAAKKVIGEYVEEARPDRGAALFPSRKGGKAFEDTGLGNTEEPAEEVGIRASERTRSGRHSGIIST